MAEFQKELEELINRHSEENRSGTPDFILAGYIRLCLEAWHTTTRERDHWYRVQQISAH